jgi:hypothetical protein
MAKGLSRESKEALYADRFAFARDEEVLINAIDLCDELLMKDHLERENIKLQQRIAWLETYVKQPEPEYRRFNIKV